MNVQQDGLFGIGAPWERIAGESAKAYAAFELYLKQLAGHRSIRIVAQDAGKDPAQIARWSSKWGWVDRVAAWDRHCYTVERDGEIEERRKMGERHASQAMELQKLALFPAQVLVERIKRNPDLLRELSDPEKLIKLSTEGAKIFALLAEVESRARGGSEAKSFENKNEQFFPYKGELANSGPDGEPLAVTTENNGDTKAIAGNDRVYDLAAELVEAVLGGANSRSLALAGRPGLNGDERDVPAAVAPGADQPQADAGGSGSLQTPADCGAAAPREE